MLFGGEGNIVIANAAEHGVGGKVNVAHLHLSAVTAHVAASARKNVAAKTPYEVFFGKECPLRFDV